MARLLARTPAEAALPRALSIGETRIDEATPDAITWVAPFDGRAKDVSTALKAKTGLTFPKPGKVTRAKAARALWCGPGQALVLGPSVAIDGAACVDQSDAWTILTLSGGDARAVLARLTPVDLRDAALPVDATARTLIGHTTASLTRVGESSWEIMVFRSMASTLVHDTTRAMRHVAARAEL